MQLWRTVHEALGTHPRCAVVSVVAVRGSAPREPGARMLVLPDGGYRGTIGGGALEWQAIAAARDAMAGRAPSTRLTQHVLGPDLGQCCGGSVKLLTEVLDGDRREEVAGLAQRESLGPFVSIGEIRPNGVRRRIDEADEADTLALAVEVVDGGARIKERFGASHHPVYLFGAGHVGRAVMLALAPLPFRVTWIDARDEAFPAVMPANIQALPGRDPAVSLAGAAGGSFVLVMTHSHPLDLEIVGVALRQDRFPYVGLIGSESKRARFSRALRRAAVPDSAMRSLVCPIGIPGIRSKHPAHIAAAVAAQLLMRLEALAPRRPVVAAQAAGGGP